MPDGVKLIIFVAAISFVYSVPIKEKFNEPVGSVKKVPCSQINADNSRCSEHSDDNPEKEAQDESTLLPSAPVLMDNLREVPYIADGQETMLPISATPYEYMPPFALPAPWARSQYQLNPAMDMEPLSNYQNYDSILYPQYSRSFAVNPGFPVNSLPSVHSTFIHGLVPARDVEPKANYDIDVLNSQNTVLLPPLARPGRMLGPSEDDFLAQLSHDAIMNNIIPTMPVPFVRYTGRSAAPYSYGAYGSPSAIAVFPNAQASGCAVPLLFSCSPKISRGVLKQSPSLEHNQASLAAVQNGYRNDASQPDSVPSSKKPIVKAAERKN